MGKLCLRAFYSITKDILDYAWSIIGEHLKAEEGKQTKNLLGAGFIDGRQADRIFQFLNGSLQQFLIRKEQNFNQNFHWPQHLTVLLVLKHGPVLLYSHIC